MERRLPCKYLCLPFWSHGVCWHSRSGIAFFPQFLLEVRCPGHVIRTVDPVAIVSVNVTDEWGSNTRWTPVNGWQALGCPSVHLCELSACKRICVDICTWFLFQEMPKHSRAAPLSFVLMFLHMFWSGMLIGLVLTSKWPLHRATANRSRSTNRMEWRPQISIYSL
jgi:hypothetical protein